MNMSGVPGEEILWSHIVELYNKEKSLSLVKWTKLTSAHVDLLDGNRVRLDDDKVCLARV